MAFDKSELTRLALEAIEKHQLVFIDEVCTFLPCSRATFYNHEIDKLDELKEALNNVRTNMKSQMRNKWRDSDNATLQIGLMKLIATDEERKRLATGYMETTQKHIAPDLSNLTTDQIIELLGNESASDE
jgi:DNA-binding transcriptional regulator YbjK